jgi:hypothetical protein
MHDESKIVDIIRDRQRLMRKAIDKSGILMKVVADDSGLSYSTLLTYFPADKDKTPVQIPGSVIFALTGHLPANIMSLLLPAGHVIVRAPEEIDHDALSELMQDWVRTKEQAHHPDSEDGREIGPKEDNVLRGKFAAVKAA